MRPSVRVALALGLAVLVASASAALATGTKAANSGNPKIESRVLADTAGGAAASIVINLKSEADLSTAYAMRDQDARGWYVYRTLKQHAARTQAPLKALLTARGASYRSFWAANIIVATADRALVEELAARPDVKLIESNARSNWLDATKAGYSFDSLELISSSTPATATKADAPRVVEPGVMQVHAPDVWALGFTGQNIVIANQDTGVRWTHQALKPHYRGWNGSTANHNYNWWDAIHSGGGSCTPNHQEPCDDDGHGTHTTGTTSGLDSDDGGANQVGVAPGAKWIGCRNMDQGVGTPATYTECFQFFMAPTDLSGQNPNPTLRAHVMNNSWGCPPSEGCAADTLRQVVENTQATGIFVEVSAGNAGPGCSTVNDPPAIYNASFSTGALTTGTNSVVSFSSRGPVTVDGSGRIKPNVVAPGTGTRSSTRTSDTSYGSLSGTSMAGPHVVGVVALLWSAHPELARNIAATKQLVQSTANPNMTASSNGSQCGGVGQIPNNHFGYGLVDAIAAVNPGAAELIGNVNEDFTINLKFPNGDNVVSIPPGVYTIQINDNSAFHNYHLMGPGGVDQNTEVEFAGAQTWVVTLVPGGYNYQCDPHADQMHGSFTVTGPAPPPPPPPPPPSPPSAASPETPRSPPHPPH